MAQAWLILADHAEKTAAHGVQIDIADTEQRS
jgi:hypothetical protein